MKKTSKETVLKDEMPAEKLNELKSTANEILAFCRQSILNKHPFIGSMAMNLDLKPIRDIRCSTAMTDGSTVYFDIDFLSRLTQDEREFVLGHEFWHVVMLHFLRGEGKEHELFNIATDMEVNQLLEKDGFTAPADVVFPNSGHSRKCMFNFPDDLSAEEYYEHLLKDAEANGNGKGGEGKQQEGEGKSGKGTSGRGGAGKGAPCKGQFDKHYDKNADYDKEAEEALKEAVSDKYGVKGLDPDFAPGKISTEGEERAAAEKVREAVVSAAQQVERSRGTLPGHVKKIVDALLEPKLPWRELLAAFVTSSFCNKTNWSTPNRRFAWSGTYLPSHDGEAMRIAVGIDTSGSCSNDCAAFLTEVNSIAKTFGSYELHVIQCDTEVKDYTVFDESNPLDPEANSIEFKGFGGTELHPIFKHLTDNDIEVDAAVVFTDGECEDFTENDGISIPVLWVLAGTQHKRDNLKIGDQVLMEGEGNQ